jgi:hypothetical protein
MCSTLPQVLLHHGLFPTAPSQPRMAVSVDLLSFYRALFERSCDAINALASALKNHYSRRGFQVTDTQVSFNYIFELLLTSVCRVNSSKTHFVGVLVMPFSGSTSCKFNSNDNSRQFSNTVAIASQISKPPCTRLISLHSPPYIQVDVRHFWSNIVQLALVAYYMVGPQMKEAIYMSQQMGISTIVIAVLLAIVPRSMTLPTLSPKTSLTKSAAI